MASSFDVAPNVGECWGAIKSDGEIRIKHEFRVIDGIAYAGKVESDPEMPFQVVDSSLDAKDDALAIECIRKAVVGSSYPFVDLNGDTEVEETTSVIYQVWRSRAWYAARPDYDSQLREPLAPGTGR